MDDYLARCDRCGRKTWTPERVNTEDRMTQPDGNPCGGRFITDPWFSQADMDERHGVNDPFQKSAERESM